MKPRYYRWEWDLVSEPSRLWPLISDTDRFNKEAGLPSVIYNPADQLPLENKRKKLSYIYLGVEIEWIEEPFEWVYPYTFCVLRRYSKGPLQEMRVKVELKPREGGTHMIYETWSTPKSLLGVVGSFVQIGILSARSFEAVTKKFDTLATGAKDLVEVQRLSSGAKSRLLEFTKSLEPSFRQLSKKLTIFLMSADESELSKIRPFVLADLWGESRREVLHLFLYGARTGILNFKWQLICPSCRGAKKTSDSLSRLETKAHCEVCKIDVNANVENAVELAFTPNPAIAQYTQANYCVGGPQLTPHILAQQLLKGKEQRQLTLNLSPNVYRVVSGMNTLAKVHITSSGKKEIVLSTSDKPARLSLKSGGELTLINTSSIECLISIEQTLARDQAVTAAEVFSLQMFRDFFATELLKSGDEISVGTIVVVFTDLKGSTKFYQEVGDANAYVKVRDHFEILEKAVEKFDGAVVKTIGDAVMAVFQRPICALEAMLEAQKNMEKIVSAAPLRLKAGIHAGPSIAVTLNGRLDYFGTTINTASRLEGQSTGEEIIISDQIYTDPEIRKFLISKRSKFSAHSFSARLKGFDTKDFKLWRITKK